MGGGIQKRIYLVEHQSRLETSEKCQRITQDTGGWIAHPDPKHWLSNSSMVGGGIGQHQPNSYQKDIWTADGTGRTPYRRNCRESESKGSYQQQMVADTSRLARTYTNTRASRPTLQNTKAMDAGQRKLGGTRQEPTTECGTRRVFSKLIV